MTMKAPLSLPNGGGGHASTDAGKNAETLFETRTVAEIREVEKTTRRDIEVKKEELRQLVGASYRDLIASADTIVDMARTCDAVVASVGGMSDGFNALSTRIKESSAEPKVKGKDDMQREELYAIGSRVKYLVDTPEMIWGYLDEHEYMDSAGRYLRAFEVHSLLKTGASKHLLGSFPLLRHQWPLVEKFNGQIIQRARARLQQEGLGTQNFAVALGACSLLESLTSTQVLHLYLEGRTGWLKGIMLATELAPLEDKSLAQQLAELLGKLVRVAQRCVSQIGELFLQTTSGKQPAFFATALEEISDAMIFGGLVKQEREIEVWKKRVAGVRDRLTPLTAEEIASAAVKWVEASAAEITAQGKSLMAAAGSAAELAQVEALVKEEIKAGEPCQESAQWLEGTLGLRPQAPWESMCELVLRRSLDVWSQFFDAAFTHRAKELVDAAFAALSLEDKVVACLREVDEAATDETGRQAVAQTWPEETVALPAQLAPSSAGATASERLSGMRVGGGRLSGAAGGAAGGGATGWRARVQELRGELDGKLEAVLKGALSLLAPAPGAAAPGGKHSARAEELEPYIQQRCHAAIAAVANSLEGKLAELGAAVPEDSQGEVPLVVVEKALFLGRLCAAVGQHTGWLRVILGPPSSWQDAKAMAAAVAGGPHGGVKRAAGGRRRFARGGDAGARDGGMGQELLEQLQQQLKRVSLTAHKVWVGWTAARLGAVLEASLVMDTELSATTAPRVWEEVVVNQGGEGGGGAAGGGGGAGGDMRLKLPASPTPYALTFLFAACRELQCAGAHLVDVQVLRLLEWELGKSVLRVYGNALSPGGALDAKGRLSEKGALQVLMDVRFLTDVLSGGADTNGAAGAAAAEAGRAGGAAGGTGAAAHKREVSFLEDNLTSRLDPIDWATYEPYLWANEKRYYQRAAVLFGSLVQLRRLHTSASQKLPPAAETNTLSTASLAPRFTYLPISTPSAAAAAVARSQAAAAAGAYGPAGGARDGSGHYTFGEGASREEESGASAALKSIVGSVGRGFDEAGAMAGAMGVTKIKDSLTLGGMGSLLGSTTGGLLGSFGGFGGDRK